MSALFATRSATRLNSLEIKPMLNKIIQRNAHTPVGSGCYRMMPPVMTYGPQIRILKCLQTTTWGWIFYNLWTDPESLLGHPGFNMPDPSLWTDEDLGIPPDDYDEVV